MQNQFQNLPYFSLSPNFPRWDVCPYAHRVLGCEGSYNFDKGMTLTATENNPLLAMHVFEVMEWAEKLLEIMGIADEYSLSEVSQEFGIKNRYDEKGEYLGTYLNIGLKGKSGFSYHEIPIDFRIPEEYKYTTEPYPDFSGDEMTFYNRRVERKREEAYELYKADK